MLRFCSVLIAVFSFVTACAAPHEPRKCPMGSMARIEAPESMAMQTAASATAKYGYSDFTVVHTEGSGETFQMLIKMSDAPEEKKASFIPFGLMARLR